MSVLTIDYKSRKADGSYDAPRPLYDPTPGYPQYDNDLNIARGKDFALNKMFQLASRDARVLPRLDHMGQPTPVDPRWAEGLTLKAERAYGRQVLGQANDANPALNQRIAALRQPSWDFRLRMGLWGIANAEANQSLRGVDTYDYAAKFATDAVGGADPTLGGSIYPGLIGLGVQMETIPLPANNFELAFPQVLTAAALRPGITNYEVRRRQPNARPAAASGNLVERAKLVRVQNASDLRATTWLVIGIQEDLIASYQAMLPGQPIEGLNELMLDGRLAMQAGENHLNWFGNADEGFPGLLADPQLANRTEVPTTSTADGAPGVLLGSGNPTDIIDCMVYYIQQAATPYRGIYQPDTAIISRALSLYFLRQVRDSAAGGMIDATIMSFLTDKVLSRISNTGIKKIVLAWELDNIGDNGEDVAVPSGKHAIMLVNSAAEAAIKRAPILPLTTTPVINQGLCTMLYMVMQIGQPYVSSLAAPQIIIFQSR